MKEKKRQPNNMGTHKGKGKAKESEQARVSRLKDAKK